MKKRFAKLDKSDENIADQYPDIVDALQKDAGQNSEYAKFKTSKKDPFQL